MQKKTYSAGGREWPVTGRERIDGLGEFPIVDIPLMSDYQWQLTCLEARLRHPEQYAQREDLPTVIGKLRAWLTENRETGEKEGLYQRFLEL